MEYDLINLSTIHEIDEGGIMKSDLMGFLCSGNQTCPAGKPVDMFIAMFDYRRLYHDI